MNGAHSRWLRKLARETDKTRLARARAAVKQARANKRTARKRGRLLCQRARVSFRRWLLKSRAELKRRIEQLRTQLKATTAAKRRKVGACCGRTERDRVRAQSDAAIGKVAAELAQVVAERHRERTWSGRGKLRPAPVKARAEKQQESDHSVEVNLTPDQLTVWHKVKSQIRGTDRMSRTEAFIHWLHDNSADVGRILAADADEAYRRAVRDEMRERARGHSKRTDKQLSSYLAAELADVPF